MAALLLAASSAFAQNPPEDTPAADAATPAEQDARARARQKFAEGRAAHDRGDFKTAAELFEEAHRIAPHASVKFNAAIAWDHAGDLPRAADAYEAALDLGGLEENQATEASARLSALKLVLGYVSVVAPVGATVSIGHIQGATIPVRVHLQPGTYRAHAERPNGPAADQTVEVSAGQTATIRFEIENLPAPTAAPKIVPQPVRSQPPPMDHATAPKRTASSSQQLWGWIALGGGLALTATAIVLGMEALDARDEFEQSGRRDVDAHDRAASLRLWTNITWGGAALSGGTGLFLLIATPKIEM